jgi:hypothetical protein
MQGSILGGIHRSVDSGFSRQLGPLADPRPKPSARQWSCRRRRADARPRKKMSSMSTTTNPTLQHLPTDTATASTSDPVAAYRTGLDHVRFWIGAALAAAIAALTALVGLLLITGVLHVWLPVGVAGYALLAAALVIGASALYNLMLHVAPHPTVYFGALAAVGIALAVLIPFTISLGLYTQIALAGLNFIVGLMIAFLVPMAAVQARRST